MLKSLLGRRRAMIQRPFISIVTACYNAVDFLEDCIRSVWEQTLSDVEHVIIDGGSDDGTIDIIRRHVDKLSYWHSKPDRGIGHAFNLGVQHSRGQWLLFLNADDFFCRWDALEVLAREALRTPQADVIYAMVQPVSRSVHPRPVSKPVGWAYRPWRFLLRDLIPHPAALTARAYFDRVGMFSEDLKIVIDYEHYLRSVRTLRTVFVPEVLTHMRVGGLSEDSTTALTEMFVAQRRNRVLPPIACSLLECFVRTKAGIGRRVRRTLHALEAEIEAGR